MVIRESVAIAESNGRTSFGAIIAIFPTYAHNLALACFPRDAEKLTNPTCFSSIFPVSINSLSIRTPWSPCRSLVTFSSIRLLNLLAMISNSTWIFEFVIDTNDDAFPAGVGLSAADSKPM